MPEHRNAAVGEQSTGRGRGGGFFIRRTSSPLAVTLAQPRSRWMVVTDNKENAHRSSVCAHKNSHSLLPAWYPRTPLRDITFIARAIESRERRLREASQHPRSQNTESPQPDIIREDAASEQTPDQTTASGDATSAMILSAELLQPAMLASGNDLSINTSTSIATTATVPSVELLQSASLSTSSDLTVNASTSVATSATVLNEQLLLISETPVLPLEDGSISCEAASASSVLASSLTSSMTNSVSPDNVIQTSLASAPPADVQENISDSVNQNVPLSASACECKTTDQALSSCTIPLSAVACTMADYEEKLSASISKIEKIVNKKAKSSSKISNRSMQHSKQEARARALLSMR